MALPQTIGSGTASWDPPMKASNGAYYVVAGLSSGGNDIVSVYKATDPSSTWSRANSAGDPVVASGKSFAFVYRATMDGGGRYICVVYSDGSTLKCRSFDTSTDTWVGSATTVAATSPECWSVAGESGSSTTWLGSASSGGHFIIAYSTTAGVLTLASFVGGGNSITAVTGTQSAWPTADATSGLTNAMVATASWDGTVNRLHVFARLTGTGVVTTTVKLSSTSPAFSSQATVYAPGQDPYIGQAVVNGSTIFLAGNAAGVPTVYKATVADAPTWSSETVDASHALTSAGFSVQGMGLAVDTGTSEMYYMAVITTQSKTDLAFWKRSSGGSWGSPVVWVGNASTTCFPSMCWTRASTLRIGVLSASTINEVNLGASTNFLRAFDSVTVSDAAVKSGPQRTSSDSVTVSDAATRVSGTSKSASDSVTVSDAATRTQARTASATDSVSVADAAAGQAGHTVAATDAVSVSDAVVRGAVAYARTTSDSVSVSDSVARGAFSISRTGADAITVIDAAARGSIHWSSTTSDSFSVSDAVTATTGKSGSASDSVSVSDTATHGSVSGFGRANDTVSVSDVAARSSFSFSRTAHDSFSVSDRASWLAPQTDVIVSAPGYRRGLRVVMTLRSMVTQSHRSLVSARER